jgi:hypothetical protein
MSRLHTALALTLACTTSAVAQTRAAVRSGPFVVGAANVGALGFTGGGRAALLLGAYGYAAFPRLIVGAQGGGTVGGPAASEVSYGMATLAYPARAIRQSLVYPFIGIGRGVLRLTADGDASGTIFAAGVGADRIPGGDLAGRLIGIRGGYLYRPASLGNRAVYVTLAVGAGGRMSPREPDRPPPVVASASFRHR